ncbi:hypothetical protein ACO2I3_20810 [Leptospira interrogans]
MVISSIAIGGAKGATDHVWSQGDRVKNSDVDLLGDLDGVIDPDTEIPHHALDLGVPG